jgi:hypothetical protein
MEGSHTFKDMISIDKSKKLNLTCNKNKNYLISPINKSNTKDKNKTMNFNLNKSHKMMSVESESNKSYAFSQAMSYSPTRVIEPKRN